MVPLAHRSWSRRCSVITRLSGRHRRGLRRAEEVVRVAVAVQALLVGVETSQVILLFVPLDGCLIVYSSLKSCLTITASDCCCLCLNLELYSDMLLYVYQLKRAMSLIPSPFVIILNRHRVGACSVTQRAPIAVCRTEFPQRAHWLQQARRRRSRVRHAYHRRHT